MTLFTPYNLGPISLTNRIVMAPMTRCRAIGNVPNDLMVEYYRQRATAGLLITEGVAPSPNGLGYARIPGIYSQAQVDGWEKVTQAVHDAGGKIFVQLMHTGRIAHPGNMEEGAEIVAPSAIAAAGEMYTDALGSQPHPVPKAMTISDIQQAQAEYVQAARNAIEAGFDGVELHAANGYLINQFINTRSNQRTDEYGGSGENRVRFAIEVAQQVAAAIGADRTGIRLSPYGTYNDLEVFEGMEATYEYLAGELGKMDLAYLHLINHPSMAPGEIGAATKAKLQQAFGGTVIACGGLDKATAEATLQAGEADLAAFGRPFIPNPDLAGRMQKDLSLSAPDHKTFYTPGEKGYTDYAIAD